MGLSRVEVERDCRFQMLPGFGEIFEVNESKSKPGIGPESQTGSGEQSRDRALPL